MATVVAVSGGFDPFHPGHIKMCEEARALGDRLVVILNNDNWLRTKKGYAYMPETDRAYLLSKYPFIDEVYITQHVENDPDRSVCEALKVVKPDIFANGGDRFADNIPEKVLCDELGIKMVFNVGGGKIASSSDYTKQAALALHRKGGLQN